ncbi:D-inositol-3-phosphate glycosyltransferase [subsurface metagenome]
MNSRISVVSEELNPPFDEGIKNFVYNLIKQLLKNNSVLAFSIRGDKTGERYIKRLNVNKTFLSYPLFKEIRHFAPAIVLYVPSPSATISSFMRTKVLKLYARKAKIVMIALQPSEYSFLSRKFIPLLIPDLTLVQSASVLKRLSTFGCCAKLIPSGVNLKRFRPVAKERKLGLRSKYGINADKFTILHVGHINRNRNIQILKELQSNSNQMLVVGSTSTGQDKHLVEELEMTGIKVITDYLENVEEIYQLSDCYVFPVVSERASIEVPLSVLEAMACNLPVVATRYGGLPIMFNSEDNGLFFLDKLKDLSNKVEKVKQLNHCETQRMVEPYSWREVAKRILELVEK